MHCIIKLNMEELVLVLSLINTRGIRIFIEFLAGEKIFKKSILIQKMIRPFTCVKLIIRKWDTPSDEICLHFHTIRKQMHL